MGDLTKNFSRKEFACECGCGFDTVDIELIQGLQSCCDHFHVAMKQVGRISCSVTGGNRCIRHNTALREKGINTAINSQHIFGRAADVKFYHVQPNGDKRQVTPENVAQFFERHFPKFSIGRYNNRTHVDSRTNGPAKWDMRT